MSMEDFKQLANDCNTYKNTLTSHRKRIIIGWLFCFNHTNKMEGIASISTSVHCNKFCAARVNNCPGTVCRACFADRQLNFYTAQAKKLEKAHYFLNNCELSEKDIPTIDAQKFPFFRFEAFGDIETAQCFTNYCTIARTNKKVNFTLWTKNPGIVQQAINSGVKIPSNLRIGLSSLYLNRPETEKANKYPFVKFLFTVYTEDYIKQHNVNINCGARSCRTCGKCYKKSLNRYGNGNALIINEKLK